MNKYKISSGDEAWDASWDGEIFDKVNNPKHYKGIDGLEVINEQLASEFMINHTVSQFNSETFAL